MISRSPVTVLAVRAASPLAVIAGVFFFFAGHNRPGGGFAAGLIFGAVVALRAMSGLSKGAPALPLLAAGGAIATLVAMFPLLLGDPVLDQYIVDTTVPLIGKIKSGSSLVFDLGVTLIVIGMVVAVLDGLGATDSRASETTDGTPA